MSAQQPSLDEISAAAHRAVDLVIEHFRNAEQDEVVRVASEEQSQAIRANTAPSHSTPIDRVVDDTIDAYHYTHRTAHPKNFAFIPCPLSPLSWLAEMLQAGFNPFAGSWFQSSGPSSVEDALLSWLANKLGMPQTTGGVFVSSGSLANLTSLVVARDQCLEPAERSKGIAYVSMQTHMSITKALRILGFLDTQIRTITTHGARMDVTELSETVRQDRQAGLKPFVIIATCGTTNTGTVDPIEQIADLTNAEGMWLHVDGAYGAAVGLSKTHRHLVQGLSRADSLSMDGHKWLWQTYGCGIVFVRDKKLLPRSFVNKAEYLRDASYTEENPNFWNFGPELTRPARAMKLWFTLKVLGEDMTAKMIDDSFTLAETAEARFRSLPNWEIVSPASMGIVVFSYAPKGMEIESVEKLNSSISQETLSTNTATLLTTQLDGRTVLRICAISPAMTVNKMENVVDEIDQIARGIHRGFERQKLHGELEKTTN